MSMNKLEQVLYDLNLYDFYPSFNRYSVDLNVLSSINFIGGDQPRLSMPKNLQSILFSNCGLKQSQLYQIILNLRKRGYIDQQRQNPQQPS
jgi:hypothetical protein